MLDAKLDLLIDEFEEESIPAEISGAVADTIESLTVERDTDELRIELL